MRISGLFIFIFFFSQFFSQEWRSLKELSKQTGRDTLIAGEWLRKDRKHNTSVWNKANIFNLTTPDGYRKYASIALKRDFYNWIDQK
jgi:hypothetical protein